jgi:hypothetical protein
VRKLAGPMGPWRRFMEAVGEDAKIAANVLIYATWTLDGQALIDRPMIRKYASIQACKYAESGYPACIVPLRSLASDATSLSDIELAGALRALSGMIRSGNQGLSADHDRKIVQNTLIRWLDADLGEGDFIQDSVGGVERRRSLRTD